MEANNPNVYMNKSEQHSMFLWQTKLAKVMHASSKTQNAWKKGDYTHHHVVWICKLNTRRLDDCVWLHGKSDREEEKSNIHNTNKLQRGHPLVDGQKSSCRKIMLKTFWKSHILMLNTKATRSSQILTSSKVKTM